MSISRFQVENSFPYKVLRQLYRTCRSFAIRLLAKRTPIQKNKIIFLTFRGEYDCNAKWICEEIIRQNLPYDLVWGVYKQTNLATAGFPPQVRTAQRGSYHFYKELASAQIIVDNGISCAVLKYRKKKKQILIETWHGAIGIKKFSPDTNKDKNWVEQAYAEGEMTDYCISNSTMENDIYRDTFWKDAEILMYGHARNDILFEKDTDRTKKIREKIYREFNLTEDTRICLYAPTFRDDKDLSPYLIDYSGLQNALETRFGGKWVIFTRFHYRVRKAVANYELPDFVINVSKYNDIQELMAFTDVAITDYSSWICEYMVTRRPGFLFATDMADFQETERSFFYPLSSMPFPLAVTNEELIDNILHFDMEKFIPACDAFLKDKGCIDDGQASVRAVEKIKSIMKEENEK